MFDDLVTRALTHDDSDLRAEYESETAEWVDAEGVDLGRWR
jgi:hypothetical protein